MIDAESIIFGPVQRRRRPYLAAAGVVAIVAIVAIVTLVAVSRGLIDSAAHSTQPTRPAWKGTAGIPDLNSDQVFDYLGFQVFKPTPRDRLWVSPDMAPLTHAYTRAEIRRHGQCPAHPTKAHRDCWSSRPRPARIVLREVSSYGGSNQWLDHKLCWFVVSPTVSKHDGYPHFVVVYDAMTGKELAWAENS